MKIQTVSKQTRTNWWTDACLALSGIGAALSGIYFLFLPQGGYQGGRNPYYNLKLIFDRHTWDDLHTWTGIAMIAIAAIHLAIHWSWVVSMARRIWKELTGQCTPMNWRGRWNLILNEIVAASFGLAAISGIYLLFYPGGHGSAGPMILMSQASWDLVHTWTGVIFIAGAVIHFSIHWKWVTKVTVKIARTTGQSIHLAKPEILLADHKHTWTKNKG